MVDPMRLWRQAWLRAWKTGCHAPERADGQGAATRVRLGICSWPSDLILREFSAGSDAAAWVEGRCIGA
jgi:hypothetical protein